jgi:hypothetical protein
MSRKGKDTNVKEKNYIEPLVLPCLPALKESCSSRLDPMLEPEHPQYAHGVWPELRLM